MRLRPAADGAAREGGAGTVLGAGLAVMLIVLMSGIVLLVQAAAAASRAATSADLAALAAADAARDLITGTPCDVAAEVAARHETVLVACTRSGPGQEIVDIETVADLPGLPGLLGRAGARSRAGPPP